MVREKKRKGLFNGRIKKALGSQFKRKVGGTKLGNAVRGFVRNKTGGLLGNGLLMLKENETKAETDAKAREVLTDTAAAATEKFESSQRKALEDVERKATMERLKKIGFTVVLPLLVVAGVVVYIFKNKKKSKRRR